MKNLYKQFLIIFAFIISSFGLKAQISGATAICQNSSANYTCSAAATYNWSVSPSGTTSISNATLQNPSITFSAAGNYTITVNTTSPVNTFTLGLTALQTPIINNVSTYEPYCFGGISGAADVDVIAGSPPLIYTWANSTGTILASGPSPSDSIVGITAGTYNVNITDANGCFINSSIIVTQPAQLFLIASTDQTICYGDSAQIFANVGGGTPPYSWSWFHNGTSIPSYSTTSFSLSNGPYWIHPSYLTPIHTYSVNLIDGNNCPVAGQTINVTSLPPITLSTSGQISDACNLSMVNLFAIASGGNTSVGGSISYNWTPSGQTTSSITVQAQDNQLHQMNYLLTASDGCSRDTSIIFTINIDSLTSISGTIYANSTPITAGQVFLFSSSQISFAHDTIAITNVNTSGQYSFTSIPAGDYFIKCVPNVATNPSPLNTYYGDVVNWQFADTVRHDCSLNSVANINLITRSAMGGLVNVSGTIVQGIGFGNRLINSNNQIQNIGDPVTNADVNLVAIPSNIVVAQTISNINGYYEFSNVDAGDYELQVDIPGLPMDSTYSLSVVSQSFSNLDFVADDNSIYPTNTIGVKQNENNANGISIYPNPAKNSINIKYELKTGINSQIEIIDNLGKILVSKKIVSELTQLNIEELNSGFYFIKIKSESGINTFRFIKQ